MTVDGKKKFKKKLHFARQTVRFFSTLTAGVLSPFDPFIEGTLVLERICGKIRKPKKKDSLIYFSIGLIPPPMPT